MVPVSRWVTLADCNIHNPNCWHPTTPSPRQQMTHAYSLKPPSIFPCQLASLVPAEDTARSEQWNGIRSWIRFRALITKFAASDDIATISSWVQFRFTVLSVSIRFAVAFTWISVTLSRKQTANYNWFTSLNKGNKFRLPFLHAVHTKTQKLSTPF